jgi:hypothetical protein
MPKKGAGTKAPPHSGCFAAWGPCEKADPADQRRVAVAASLVHSKQKALGEKLKSNFSFLCFFG